MNKTRKYQENLLVVSSIALSASYHLLQLQLPPHVETTPIPGQFVQLLIEKQADVFLRRPISIHGYHEKFKVIDLLIKKVGKGTEALSQLKPGDQINTLFFLGNTFDSPTINENVLFVAAGAGIAPLYFAFEHWQKSSNSFHLIYAAKTATELVRLEEIKTYVDKIELMTDDGTLGKQGLITQHPWLSASYISQFDRIYACGPEPVLHWLISKYNSLTKPKIQVSLEHRMACGFGVCLGCVVKTTKGNQRTCVEGPVFNVNELYA